MTTSRKRTKPKSTLYDGAFEALAIRAEAMKPAPAFNLDAARRKVRRNMIPKSLDKSIASEATNLALRWVLDEVLKAKP